jgi:hypothetical protein
LTKGTYTPGNTGMDGFSPDETWSPRVLLNGVFTVREPGTDEDCNGLLVLWKIPDEAGVFEKIARWGNPWWLMSGGRQ